MTMDEGHQVLVYRCEEYHRDAIKAVLQEGLTQLDYRPTGRVFVKPNVVFAGDPDVFGSHAYTQPTFVGANVELIAGQPGIEAVDVGEKCAIGFPTRYCFRKAGYTDEMARVAEEATCPVNLRCIEEEAREVVFVGGKVHDTLRLARPMARADSLVYLPKLKCHCVSRMTGAVKLNIGICSDDERSIRHDFMLNDKIVDLLAVGWPDLVVMDAIDVGVGNEAFPTPRRLGLVLMGTNPLAVDLVAARLLGLELEDVPYLARAVERGYRPGSLQDVRLGGDVTELAELDEHARRIQPYDHAFTAWQDIHRELDRLRTPMRFVWGNYDHRGERCETGCVMGLKMFLASYEQYAGAAAFADARPVTFVIGQAPEAVDGRGEEVFLLGTCSQAEVHNARRVTRVDKCFTTASDMTLAFGNRLGLPNPMADRHLLAPVAAGMARSALSKLRHRRYTQDAGHFLKKTFMRKL